MSSELIPLVFDDPQSEKARAFAKHLQELLSLSDSDRKECLLALSEFRLTRTNAQQRQALDNLSNKCTAERHQVAHAISVLTFFLDGLLQETIPDDDYEYWVDDISDRKWLQGDQSVQLRNILDCIVRDYLPTIRVQVQERRTTGGVLPMFKSFGYTVEVRPIRKEIFRWGNKVSEYEPEILGTVQVASISIGVDEGLVEDIYFQADANGVDNMLSSLQALQKEMAAFDRYLNLSDSREGAHND